jgi:DNA polymerase-3 subunit gamma/tau
MLSNAAWNALLKTLEEPPPHVRFIFATTEGDKVLATIISRCQRFDLRRIQTNDIVSRLKHICGLEKVDAAEDALLAIARGAEGGMRDALSSLDQLISFKGDKIGEEDALGVFGLVSRGELENLAGAILKGDSAAILSSIETFDSAGKNMRRLAGELLMHFRNLVVLMALGPNSKSLTATPDQIRVLTAQAEGADAGRIFRVCDQLAELEDKLRHVLSVRTLIEMSLIRASRIATTATVEELLKAVRALKSGEPVELARNPGAATPVVEPPAVSRPSAAPAPAPAAPPPTLNPAPAAEPVAASGVSAARKAILDDPKLNGMLDAFPGSGVTNIRDGL